MVDSGDSGELIIGHMLVQKTSCEMMTPSVSDQPWNTVLKHLSCLAHSSTCSQMPAVLTMWRVVSRRPSMSISCILSNLSDLDQSS